MGLLQRLLGDASEKEIRRLEPIVQDINQLESEYERLSEDALRAKTEEFRADIAETLRDVPEERQKAAAQEALDGVLPEAFAAVREASKRTIGLRPFDVQLLGGAVLHKGKIAEMKTGEGKTLVATLPIYLNALRGRGAHLVTVNDYLSRRDAGWMGPIYHALGLSVAAIGHEFSGLYDPAFSDPHAHHDDRLNHFRPVTRREAYGADITYGTNNEFGFDYLRDNMVLRVEDIVLRDLYYAIVDEVDFILIDEARTPLIISGMVEAPVDRYRQFAQVVRRLTAGTDYTVEEKIKNATLTDEGVANLERLLGLGNMADPEHFDLMHHIHQALRALACYKKDVDYVVKDGQVIIVDEFTGRLMFGRRYSDGLHQAIEAAEGVKVERESQTLATITFQNFFRMYEKLAGMTGTAKTEEEELQNIYNLSVVVVPTHRAMVREDHTDVVYKSERAKWKAIVTEIEEEYKRGRPVLVGTRSIETNERLSEMLRRRGVAHQILNAKQHEREAETIAQAGRVGAVTVATNMAGRGVDIILGGNPPEPGEAEKVRQLGGLHVLGTERHEARRIDNQLRGRSGRQGDAGSSRFYVALDDELMRIFGGERVAAWMDRLRIDEDTPIEASLVSRQIQGAQKKVEQYHFDVRRHVLEYDDVMNVQRKVIYEERRKVLRGENLRENLVDMIERLIEDTVALYCPPGTPRDEWDVSGLQEAAGALVPALAEMREEDLRAGAADQVQELLTTRALEALEAKEQEVGAEAFPEIARLILLQVIDRKWIDHLHNMEALREGIGLRAYAQVSPLIEYQREGYDLFQEMLRDVQEETVKFLMRVQLEPNAAVPAPRARQPVALGGRGGGGGPQPLGGGAPSGAREHRKIGRNDPCWCGSGKKYKKCHGRES